jgi:hypothetical protein
MERQAAAGDAASTVSALETSMDLVLPAKEAVSHPPLHSATVVVLMYQPCIPPTLNLP